MCAHKHKRKPCLRLYYENINQVLVDDQKIKAAKKKMDEEKLKKVNITDPDARIMKHKDGSLKPSYNCQVAVDEKERIIVAADLVDEENDLHQIEPMIENVKETLGYKPTIMLADAGYFSYDNVQFLLDEEIDAYIPDNFYEVEKRGKTKKFRKLLFTYDVKKDCYYCPAAFEIPFTRIQKRENEPDLRHYVCKYCSLCVLKNACTDSKNRTITRDPREHLMEDMRAKLNTEEGTEQYQNRMCTVEPVFGQMKQDRGFREFLLRGKRKTKIEFIMMCTVHNIKKIADFIKRKGKSLKEILNMIAVGGSLGWNKKGNSSENSKYVMLMMIINEFLLKRSIETRYYPIVEFKMVLRQLDKLSFKLFSEPFS